ncbi:hypothetical protein GVO57_13910 [Sphingomonas changnyeongensis]|uniref:Uncharacterized protein n=1 Tax=Sphingomonas changnyeongensis TaxID=2698679 RepID=A0A7Z2NYF0_9SPHN|nr:hypothetical protein [Sphingomonas changnyeongensis]QHL91690.1 hypothetical protein GVO57_13910 [Sphingomonas changnyeongensis]
MLLNHLLVEAGYSGYFPLSTIIARSRGGFELALRSAELQGNWTPITTYVIEALLLAE